MKESYNKLRRIMDVCTCSTLVSLNVFLVGLVVGTGLTVIGTCLIAIESTGV